MQTEIMREKTFNMRLTPEEWARFEGVAKRHEMPVASLLRLLVKREEEALKARDDERRSLLAGQDDFRWEDHHTDILTLVSNSPDPMTRDQIGLDMAEGNTWSRVHYGGWPGLGLSLNQLARNGYLRRLKVGYRVTDKGRAAL